MILTRTQFEAGDDNEAADDADDYCDDDADDYDGNNVDRNDDNGGQHYS